MSKNRKVPQAILAIKRVDSFERSARRSFTLRLTSNQSSFIINRQTFFGFFEFKYAAQNIDAPSSRMHQITLRKDSQRWKLNRLKSSVLRKIRRSLASIIVKRACRG